ncbi:MAG: hypothetical protein QNJ88_16965 [Acidimicrobiia bacterium]|nr:hypothetical protein [Acidimicrobiia bacterium]
MTSKVEYRAFVLRLWWEEAGSGPRASVTAIDDGRIWVFTSLDELCRWLLDRFGTVASIP